MYKYIVCFHIQMHFRFGYLNFQTNKLTVKDFGQHIERQMKCHFHCTTVSFMRDAKPQLECAQWIQSSVVSIGFISANSWVPAGKLWDCRRVVKLAGGKSLHMELNYNFLLLLVWVCDCDCKKDIATMDPLKLMVRQSLFAWTRTKLFQVRWIGTWNI